jgi:hypothetical protein
MNNLDNNQLVCDSHMNCMLKDDLFRDVVVSSDNMRDAIVKNDNMRDAIVKDDEMRDAIVKNDNMRDAIVKDDNMRDAIVKDLMRDAIVKDDMSHESYEATVHTDTMRDAIVKDDNMRDAIVKDLMRDAIVKNDLDHQDDVSDVSEVLKTSLAGFIKRNTNMEHSLENAAFKLEAQAKKDLARALSIKNHMIAEEAAVEKNVHDSVAAWRHKWDSKLSEDDARRESEDAAELASVEKEEWNTKQRVVKAAVDAKLSAWAKALAAKVEKERKLRIAADKKDRQHAIQAAIDAALKKWQAAHDAAEAIRKAKFEKFATSERARVLETAAANAMKRYHNSKIARKIAAEEAKAKRDEAYDRSMDAKRLSLEQGVARAAAMKILNAGKKAVKTLK